MHGGSALQARSVELFVRLWPKCILNSYNYITLFFFSCPGLRQYTSQLVCLGRISADGVEFRDMFPQHHVLLPVRQEVCDPPVLELNAELKLTNKILAYVPGESRCWRV